MSVLLESSDVQLCLMGLEVSDADVVTVQKALCSCDPARLVAAMLSPEMGWNRAAGLTGGKGGRALVAKVAASLQVMGLVGVESEPGDTELLVPIERYEVVRGLSGTLRRRVRAAVVDLRSIDQARRLLSGMGGSTWKVSRAVRFGDAAQSAAGSGPWSWSRLVDSLDGFAWASWPRTLGMRLWIPRSLAEADRYRVLGSVFWAMTYLGFDGGAESVGLGERLSERDLAAVSPVDARDGKAALCDACLERRSCLGANREGGSAEGDWDCMSNTAALLFNFNCWIDCMESAVRLSDCLRKAS